MPGFDLNEIIRGIAVGALPILFAITVHEAAHGYVARHYGDRTAEMLGRLTLNPLRHIDPIGTIAVPLFLYVTSGFLFGWAKPVPIGYQNLRNPKRDMTLVAAAGPAVNILMAIGWAIVLKVVATTGLQSGVAGPFLVGMAQIGIFINILLAVFNLMPVPPLDGGRVLRGLVSESLGRYLDRIEPFGLIIIVLLLFTGLLWVVVEPLFSLVQNLVVGLVGL